MKSAGEYALLWANGMKWPDVVAAIREEMVLNLNQVEIIDDARLAATIECPYEH